MARIAAHLNAGVILVVTVELGIVSLIPNLLGFRSLPVHLGVKQN